MIDGVLEWRNAWENQPDEIACPHTMRPVLSHKVACIGANQARTLSSWGNQSKVEIVGVPRFDRYFIGDRFDHPKPLTRSVQSESPMSILVVTAKTPAFTNQQMDTVKRSLLDLKSYADQPANNVQLRWRLTAGLDSFLGVENQATDLTGGQLHDQLQTVDAVIATPSTSVIEAMLCDLPTAVLNYHVCPTYLSAAWQINGPDQLAAVIRELRARPAAKMMFQRETLSQTLACQSSATENMQTLIQMMADSANQQIAAGKKLCFPHPLLSLAAVTHGSIDHVQLFPDEEAFQQSNTLELQALLSNAHRHIKQQENRIAVLEAELTEAHGIFEQINNHPLAGPVVRLRKRILKVLSAGSRTEVILDKPDTRLSHESKSPTS
jgi:hypothetical protein